MIVIGICKHIDNVNGRRPGGRPRRKQMDTSKADMVEVEPGTVANIERVGGK